MSLPRWLLLPKTQEPLDLDSPDMTLLHRQVIERKLFLRELYRDFYKEMIQAIPSTPDGIHIELGSGGGFMKNVLPQVITSDIQPLSLTDCCFSAEAMSFRNSSVDAFYMLNTAHHFGDAERAFGEIDRCLKPGGSVVMIEPANTPWGRFVYRNFHHETFDPLGDWTFESSGPLSGGNGALPFILFVRDRSRFEETFPRLHIEEVRCHTPMRYLLSGGFTLRQLAPSWSHGLVRGLEKATASLGFLVGMFMTVRIRKAS